MAEDRVSPKNLRARHSASRVLTTSDKRGEYDFFRSIYSDVGKHTGVLAGILAMSVCFAAAAILPADSRTNCSGLHAGIRAQWVPQNPPLTEPAHVQLVFILLNDAEFSIDSSPASWTLVIDGKEVGDSGQFFGNGPMPVGGHGKLNSGGSYDFGKAFPADRYLPGVGEHKISWKGRGFQSPTITFSTAIGIS